jgi:3-methylcrotonyl-CoA carboxylase alpha subunit
VEQGDEITPHYDPMIAKLIVWGADRNQALARMRQALAQYRVVGVHNNIDFLARLVASPSFSNADLDTGLIERETEWLFPKNTNVPDEVWLLATLAELAHEARLAAQKATYAIDRDSPWRALDGWRLNGQAQRTVLLRLGDTLQTIGVQSLGADGEYALWLNRLRTVARASLNPYGELLAHVGERHMRATVLTAGDRRHVFFEGRSWPLTLASTLQTSTGDEVEGSLKAPMPGKVIALSVAVGTVVDKGAPLLVMEAMKMEHTITAPSHGIVKAFHYAAGDQVGDGADLVEFEPVTPP